MNRGGVATAAPPGSSGLSRRAPPQVGRGISASTKSGGPSKAAEPKNVPTPTPKPVARVPVVARVPPVSSSSGKDTASKPTGSTPNKASPLKQSNIVGEKKSQRPEAARPR